MKKLKNSYIMLKIDTGSSLPKCEESNKKEDHHPENEKKEERKSTL